MEALEEILAYLAVAIPSLDGSIARDKKIMKETRFLEIAIPSLDGSIARYPDWGVVLPEDYIAIPSLDGSIARDEIAKILETNK